MILETALMCLALNVFYESRSEPLEGQKAIAQVTINRAGHESENVCKVVLEPKQFSWTNGFTSKSYKHQMQHLRRLQNQIMKSNNSHELRAWQTAYSVAQQALDGDLNSQAYSATYYYNLLTSKPRWRLRMKVVCRIGRHVFLRAA